MSTIVNILKICEAALSAAQTQLNSIEEKIRAADADLSAHDRKHLRVVKDLGNSKKKYDEIIGRVTSVGGNPPADLVEKAAKIEVEIKIAQNNHNNSANRIELQIRKSQLEKEYEDAKAKRVIWNEKTAEAKYLALQHEKGHRKEGLGLVEIASFKTLEEAEAAYISQVPIVMHVCENGLINKVTYWPSFASEKHLTIKTNNQPSLFLQEIPNSLSWLSNLDSYELMLKERNRDHELPNNDGVYFVGVNQIVEDESAPEKSLPMIDSWHNYLTCHKSNFYKNFLFYVEATQEFYSGGTKIIYEADIEEQKYTETIFENKREYDISKLFKPFKKHETWSETNLPKELTKRGIWVMNQFTSSTQLFEPRNERLSKDLIEKEIGIYWKAFIYSPWDPEIRDSAVRMLKHLCERGIETPNIWTYNHKGHYGFIVRTRDHTWIKGEIFCPPSALLRTEPITDVKYERQYVNVGKATINVHGFSHD